MNSEVLEEFAQLIMTALGLVAALAWNTAIQDLFDRVFGEAGPGWPASLSTPPS